MRSRGGWGEGGGRLSVAQLCVHLYLDLLVAQLVVGRLLYLLRPRSPGCSFRSLGIALFLYRKQMLAQGE